MTTIVTGMHRSGTSALTKALHICSFSLGKDPTLIAANDANPNGYWERKDVVDINDKLLSILSSSWDDPICWLESNNSLETVKMYPEWLEIHPQLRLVASKLSGNVVVKDPRFSLTLPIWAKYITDLSIIFCYRSPGSVADSLLRRDGIPRELSFALWEAYNRRGLQHQRTVPLNLVRYENLVRNPSRELENITAKLPELDPSKISEAASTIITPGISEAKNSTRPPSHLSKLLNEIDISADLVDSSLSYYSSGVLISSHFSRQFMRFRSTEAKSDRSVDIKKIQDLSLKEKKQKERADRAEERAEMMANELAFEYDRTEYLLLRMRRLMEAKTKELRECSHETTNKAKELQEFSHEITNKAGEILTNAVGPASQVVKIIKDIEFSRSWRLVAVLIHTLRKLRREEIQISPMKLLSSEAQATLETIVMGQSRMAEIKIPEQTDVASAGSQSQAVKTENGFWNFPSFMNWACLQRVTGIEDESVKRVYGHLNQACFHLPAVTSRPVVSIILPVYNRVNLLRKAIDSVVKQTYNNWELIVVDDCSNENIRMVVESFKDERIVYHRLNRRRGAAVARNQGLSISKGDLITYVDSDNLMLPAHIEGAVRTFQAYPEADCGFSAQEVLTIENDQIVTFNLRFGPFNRALLENRNYIDLAVFVHRRSLYQKLGGFDEGLKRLIDWEMILRYTWSKAAVPIPVLGSRYFYGASKDQISSTEDMEEAMVTLRDIASGDPISVDLSERILSQNHRIDEKGRILSDNLPLTALPIKAKRIGKKREISVIIPSFQALDYLELAIASLQKYSPQETEIIVVDNASDRDLQEMLEEKEGIRVIQKKSNMGFTYAVNQGIVAAGKRDIILFNNDAVATPFWVEAMWEVLDKFEDAGLVVPRQVLPAGTKTQLEHVPYSDINWECDVNLSLHHHNVIDARADVINGFVEVDFAPFFCVYIPRKTIDSIGLLDSKNGRHYRSDRLYCDTLKEHMGAKIIYTPWSKVYHFLQRSTDQLRSSDRSSFMKMFVHNSW